MLAWIAKSKPMDTLLTQLLDLAILQSEKKKQNP